MHKSVCPCQTAAAINSAADNQWVFTQCVDVVGGSALRLLPVNQKPCWKKYNSNLLPLTS